MTDPAVAVRNITHQYGERTALRDVSLAADRGVTVLLGPNGAGKTTLLKIVQGLVRPTSGSVLVAGADPQRDRSRVAAEIGELPQDPRLSGHLRVIDIVQYAGWLKGMDWSTASVAAGEALGFVDLVKRSGSRVRELSGGMQRRVAIAMALVHRPAVLVLDEPMNGLDPEQRAAVRDIIVRWGRQATVLLSTHILHDLPGVADRVVVVADGTVRFDDTLRSLTALAPDADLEAAYFAAIR